MKDPSSSGLTPLCVDLDGTLVRTDTFIEGILGLLRRNAIRALATLSYVSRGRARLKREVAMRGPLDAASLPYRAELVDFLRAERSRGRRLILATAADRAVALSIAAHLALFDDVVASDGATNLKGAAKLSALQARLGTHQFDYAGNGPVDLPIWRALGRAILVGAPPSVRRAIQRDGIVIVREFHDAQRQSIALLRAMRPLQWLKNLLVFVPLVLAHRVTDASRFVDATVAFAAFGLTASSVYLINDLLDLEADRQHRTKRRRPLPAGELSLSLGILAIPVLLGAGVALAEKLPGPFSILLGSYFLGTLAYSLYLKRVVLADALVLAGLYTIRVMAGGAATVVPVSHWAMGFSIFFFLSLALVKRYSELHAADQLAMPSSSARGYVVGDLSQLSNFGTASGYLAILVLALYLNSPEVRALYSRPLWLWSVCVVLIYWVSRVWLLAHRGQMLEDPVLFALRDRVSYLLGALCALALWIAT